jgi:hypothetical protein
MQRFPDNFGNELAAKSFEDIFEYFPKWVACVEHTWTENCTGLFKEFREYIALRLKDSESRKAHDKRCYDYVKPLKHIPGYLLGYVNRPDNL